MWFSTFKPRNLFWSYAIVSLMCAALISLAPAWFLSRFIATRMLERDAAVSMQFAQAIVENLDARAVLPGLPPSSPPLAYGDLFTETDSARVNAIFGAFSQRLRRQPDIVRISVYAPDGRRIWSTNPRLVGSRDLGNAKLVHALLGELAVSTEHTVSDMSAAEQARVTSKAPIFSEMYLPIWNRSGDIVVGMVEIYKVSDMLFSAISQSQRWIWGGAIVGGLLLYGVLLGLMRRAVQIIKRQREKRTLIPPSQGLFKLYVVLSLLFVGLLIVGPTWPLSGYIHSRMLERDATVTMQFVQTLLEDMDASAYLPTPPAAEPAPTYTDFFIQTDPEQINAIFGDFRKRLPLPLELLDIVRISVYAPDGMRIWATQPEQVGIRWLGNSKLVQALNGELAVDADIEIWQLSEEEEARVTSKTPIFSEMYMPIWNPSRDTVVGVVEVYKDSDVLFRTIAQGQRWFWGGTIGLGLLLLGVLLGIMRRAVRIMEQQHRKLVASETLSVVGEMVSAIAHLLRQPLAAIGASAKEILGQDLYAIEPQGQGIQAEVDQLETWLQGLQSYAQPHGHSPAVVELSTVVHDIVQRVRPGLDQQKIRLQLDVADALPLILADPALLHQVFHTVITNAQDAMPDGGTLSIRVTGANLSRLTDIQIGDTGHGMTPEQLDQVFQPFFTTKRRGLGIGMALAKRVVERQGGTIAIASIEGQGTTVTLSFPTATGDGDGVEAQ